MDDYLAHIRKGPDGNVPAVQTVAEHCRNTARYAAQALEPAGLSAGGYLSVSGRGKCCGKPR